MIGQYVRMVVAPHTRIGMVKAVRFDKDHVSLLFHQDPRLAFRLPDIWLQSSEVEECKRLTDEEVEKINAMKIQDD
jgi:hypothetical protein